MNFVYIISGPPGSVKSTLANHLIEKGLAKYHCETDKFFVKDGVYKFDPSKLGENHAKCFTQFCEYVNTNDGSIIVSNTGIKKWEYEKYKDFAEKHGFKVFVVAMRGNYQNIHGVPQDKVDQMRKNLEF